MKIGFISLGCAKNLTDAEIMAGILASKGHELCSQTQDAEVVIVNTCGFIDSAKEESISAILEMAQLKEQNCKLLIVTGCLAQRYSEEFLENFPEVDAVVGTGSYTEIAEIIDRASKGEKCVVTGDISAPIIEDERRINTCGAFAYLKIAEGCDNKCTYCIIPRLRGKYRSRKPESIIKEAEALAKEGVKELIVIAQDTSRYGQDLEEDISLAKLLGLLCKIENVEWVRVLYLYPEMITDELIEAFVCNKKLVPYVDMPIQHCNNTVLKRMGRRTSKEQILKVISKLRENVKDITIRTSLIAGFPGETEEQFSELLEFVKEVRFDRLGAFAYSKEEDTPAALLPDQIPQKEKERRARAIIEAQSEISRQKQKKKEGKILRVLTEGYDEENFMYYGRSESDAPEVDTLVYFASEEETQIGTFANVLILDSDEYDLTGKRLI
ncbi:MAG: 30S ribosomal protein S12 methylthiotransferase RimO [Ruminococcaceae bacterium]|nr:30S ribosomal protein S12 methylthiotransferase RimO [Oscillospiraceae bacterium]